MLRSFFNLAGESEKAKLSAQSLYSGTFVGTRMDGGWALRASIEPMALGNLTKQLATQALNDQVNNVLDALRPGDAAKAEPAKEKTTGTAENLGQVIVAELQAMQKALKEDQELVLTVNAGLEALRVLDIYLPTGQLLVLTGLDPERNVTRVIGPAATLQLTCKVMKVNAGAKPARLNFILPKA
jgi:hypothetical protein